MKKSQERPTLVLTLAALLATTACSPSGDWREMRPTATGTVARFPCKPDAHARRLALAGQTVELTLHACQHDGATFALAAADVGDPRQVAPALTALLEATRANLGATPAAAVPAQVPGMTPQAAAQRVGLQGRLPDGAPVAAVTTVFSHGTRVLQATVIGRPDGHADVQTFLDGLRVAP